MSECIASARASRVARRTAKARPISSNTVPIAAVSMNWRHNGAVNVSSAMPAATVQPVISERAKAVSRGTPSSETVATLALRHLNISANSVGDARCPMVFSGFGKRAKLTPFWSKNENVQCSFGRWRSMIRWNSASEGLNERS